ncbi:hypothetical protein D4764_20G0005970 [Takifugu flavidus]|uniref:Fibronectin type-III domain-containing protein n=1 Tax=Takifugu flavidus TaxID=433684 RepID=A0A5C6NI30_9TELE|nr:hypothetical protein D4764_20G0005970 [Takifugu flavidus]
MSRGSSLRNLQKVSVQLKMPERPSSPALLTVIWFVWLRLSQAQIQTDEASESTQEKTEFESFSFSIKEVSEGPAVLNVLKVSLLWENLELVSAAGRPSMPAGLRAKPNMQELQIEYHLIKNSKYLPSIRTAVLALGLKCDVGVWEIVDLDSCHLAPGQQLSVAVAPGDLRWEVSPAAGGAVSAGDYSCWDSRGRLLHTVRLRLGHPPGLLSISCQVPNHMLVRCSWVDLVDTFLPGEYTASFRGQGDWEPCVVDAVRKQCEVHHPAFWQALHTLRVTETNGLGSCTTTNRFALHTLLKPDPPESVSVRQIEGFSTRLMVSWNFPSSWPLEHAFPLLFHIRYRPLGSMFWSELLSTACSEMISDALAGHVHQVQVRAQDEINNDSQWSDWSPVVLVRPWEVPATTQPTEDATEHDVFTFQPNPGSSTAKIHYDDLDNESNLGLVIVLVLFSVVVLVTIFSLIFVVWFRQRRRDHVTMQEVASVVKMKSMPI